MDTLHDPTTVQVLALDDPRADDATVVGSKAAGLARLVAESFPVPDGRVLAVGVSEAWPDGDAPGSLRAAVDGICSELPGPYAVRTSATWEDGATSAHAGATATVLDVTGTDEVLAALRHCIDESARAALEHDTTGGMAVIVQRLVPADWAGVAFTADPMTGERGVVRVAAAAGLGEALVQGEVTGIDVVVRGDRIEGELGDVPAEIVLAVAEQARRVESVLGRPQDVEWATADGDVLLVQARPITVLPVEPTLPEGNNWQKDTAHYPEPLTPFGWSVLHSTADQVREVFDETGLLIRGLEEVFVGGEIYGRVLPAFGSPDSAAKPPPAFVLGIAARLVPALRRRQAVARSVLDENRMQRWVDAWHDRDRSAMASRAAALAEVELGALDDRELAAHLDAALDLVKDGQRIHFRLLMPMVQGLYGLHRLVADELGWDASTITTMLGGHSPATCAAEESMARLRRRVRDTDGAVEALETQPDRPREALAALDHSLAAELDDWTSEHGWAPVNYDAGVHALAERPSLITRLLLAEPDPVDRSAAEEIATRARAEIAPSKGLELDAVLAEARAMYALREDNTVIVGDRPVALMRRIMLEAARRLAARGEIPAASDGAYLLVEELRDAVAGKPAADLTDRIVRRRGEEAWVRAHPGPAYIGEQGAPPDVSRLPAALRRVNEPILWMVGHEYPTPAQPSDDTAMLLAGVAASPGVAEGPVRVIRSHHDMEKLRDGDVLVCQVTSPAWAPLFPLARAVVADGGGVLSHAAIAAREHGIPAVLGTSHGTTTLGDGQLVRVDGNRGLVLEMAAEAERGST